MTHQNAPQIEGYGTRGAVLLAAEAVCVIIIYWQGLPIYRTLISNQEAHEPQQQAFVWVVVASILIQAAYWSRYRRPGPTMTARRPVAGHLLLFASRLLFLFAGAVFSYLFIAKRLENQLPLIRYVGILFALFSVFCFTREVELMGKRLMGNPLSESNPAAK